MQIINCEVENLEECARLLVQVYAEPQYKEDWNEFDAHKYLKRFFDIEPNRCFIATENDIIVGGIFAYSYPWHSEILVYVQELFVDSNERKKGIAKSLLKSICNNGNTKIWLVANENTGASEFYKKLGFKKDGPYKFNYGELSF